MFGLDKAMEGLIQLGAIGIMVVLLVYTVIKLFNWAMKSQNDFFVAQNEWRKALDANTLAINRLADVIEQANDARQQQRPTPTYRR